MPRKKGIVIAWLCLLLAGIGFLFWRSEWIYHLPTPVPPHYQDIRPGARIDLSRQLLPVSNKPLLLHFFNPDCPCSRFNIAHFKALVSQYHGQADFAIVLMSDKPYTGDEIREKFGFSYPVPVLKDSALARACGVYSTPQAVILDGEQKLFYRGNYNRSRYCSDERSSYARIALDGLLHHRSTPISDPLALTAYGCQLPTSIQ